MDKNHTLWEVSDIDISCLSSIDPKEFDLWKVFPVHGLFIVFIFRRLESENDDCYFNISRYYLIDKVFEKPKKISKSHKLFDLYYCFEMSSNILLVDKYFLLFNSVADEVLSVSVKDFLSL